jgi:hypothetical protein
VDGVELAYTRTRACLRNPVSVKTNLSIIQTIKKEIVMIEKLKYVGTIILAVIVLNT